MADTEAIQQAVVQATVKAPKATILVISREGRRQSIHAMHNGVPEAPRHRMGPSQQQSVSN